MNKIVGYKIITVILTIEKIVKKLMIAFWRKL